MKQTTVAVVLFILSRAFLITGAPTDSFPEPEVATWSSQCILVKMAAQLNFIYETKDNRIDSGLYNIPKDDSEVYGHCNSDTTQYLKVKWGPATAQYTMVLQFDRLNGITNMKMLFTLPLWSNKNFPDAKENQTVQLDYRGGDFNIPEEKSYHCARPQNFKLNATIGHSEVFGIITVHDVQVEAFRPSSDSGFSAVVDCEYTGSPTLHYLLMVGVWIVYQIVKACWC